MHSLLQEALTPFFPEDTFTYFDFTHAQRTDKTMTVILTEKNHPPTDKKVTSHGFTEITIADFPIRGRETTVTYRRRRWLDADGKIIKKEISLTAPGTRLETEFALFLKDEG